MSVSPARAAAFDILLRVETQSAYASELLHSERLDELSAADRGLATVLHVALKLGKSQAPPKQVASAASAISAEIRECHRTPVKNRSQQMS